MGGFFSAIINFFFGDQRPVPMVQTSFRSDANRYRTDQPQNNWFVLQSARVNDEREFFQLFFSGMDQIQGYRGILQRWERVVQRVQNTHSAQYDLRNVWPDGAGYVETLQRVQEFVCSQSFSFNRRQLLKLANEVVARRQRHYNDAVIYGRADAQHETVLEQWRAVRNTLQNLL